MKLTKRETVMIIIAVILLVTTFLSRRIIIPTYQNYMGLKEEIADLEHDLEMNQMVIEDKEKYLKKLETVNDELEAVKSYIYLANRRKVKLKVIETIDKLLQKNSLKLVSKDLKVLDTFLNRDDFKTKLNQAETLTKINYRATVEGDIEDITYFLEDLTAQNKLYTIKELELKGGKTREQLSVYIIVEVYCLEREAANAKI